MISYKSPSRQVAEMLAKISVGIIDQYNSHQVDERDKIKKSDLIELLEIIKEQLKT